MSVIRAIASFFHEILPGCSHSRQTRIFTVQQETYRVCLDCGKHIPYSPLTMRPLTAREIRNRKAVPVAELRVVPIGVSTSIALQTVDRKSSAA